jgi:hypothetical protein
MVPKLIHTYQNSPIDHTHRKLIHTARRRATAIASIGEINGATTWIGEKALLLDEVLMSLFADGGRRTKDEGSQCWRSSFVLRPPS